MHVAHYQRLLPLVTSDSAISFRNDTYRNIRDGDCVVAFSRKEIHRIKAVIEQRHPRFRCFVVYGNLPPDARKEQARLFNRSSKLTPEPTRDIDAKGTVLIASDAIG